MVCDGDKLTFNSPHVVQEARLSSNVCYVMFPFIKNGFTFFLNSVSLFTNTMT